MFGFFLAVCHSIYNIQRDHAMRGPSALIWEHLHSSQVTVVGITCI